jgi:hypothetical protein
MSSVVLSGDTSGTVTLTVPAVAGTNTVTIPAATGTMVYKDSNGITTLNSNASQPPLVAQINGTEVGRFDSSGNFLVNTTSANAKLTVVNAGDGITAKTLVNNNYSTFVGYNLSGSVTFVVSGNGAVTKSSGTFRIEHPLPEKASTHDLVHSFIEGPNADLIYRGKVRLINGKANVNIDTEARMTNGTFALLCRNVQCFTTNESDWTAVKGYVKDNILFIEAQDTNSTAEISWMVIGERQDKHMYDTNWTDENGKPIIEPLKKVEAKTDEQLASIK